MEAPGGGRLKNCRITFYLDRTGGFTRETHYSPYLDQAVALPWRRTVKAEPSRYAKLALFCHSSRGCAVYRLRLRAGRVVRPAHIPRKGGLPILSWRRRRRARRPTLARSRLGPTQDLSHA